MSEAIDEKTKISLSISSWWHVGVIVAVIMGCYFGLRAETDKAVQMSKETSESQKATDQKVNSMQMNLQSVADDVKWFRNQYERDMSRYVREPGDKRAQ